MARKLAAAVLLAFLLLAPGCSLFVMGGRMIMGETKEKSQFRQATHQDLAKQNRKVLVLCTAADSVQAAFPSVELDILEGVTHRLRNNGIKKMVSSDAVAGWIDDHGGQIDDLGELADHFHAEYVLHIEIKKFSCAQENSPDLLRGNSEGHVRAYQLDGKKLRQVMTSDYVSTFPQGNPVSIDKKSAKNFQQEYLDRLCLQLAQTFYDHPKADELE